MMSVGGRGLPILMYHSISSVATKAFKTWALPEESFDEQLRYLHSSGFTSLTVSDLIDARRSGTVPERGVVLTFDDGFADFSTAALPILEKYSFRATLFVATAYVGQTSRWLRPEGEDGRRMMSWDQIRDARRRGIEIGAHTHTHPMLDLVDVRVAHAEIAKSKSLLEEKLGGEVRSFAYPFGYRTPAVRASVKQLGFAAACSGRRGLNSEHDDPFDLPRLVVPAEMSVTRYIDTVTGKGVPQMAAADSLKTYVWRQVRRTKRAWQSLRGEPLTESVRS